MLDNQSQIEYNSRPMPFGVRSPLVSSLAFFVPAIMYLTTLAPGTTWAYEGWDGAELITASYTLGIPHPPGSPTYVLIGWLASHLPLGTIAWRYSLLSALAVAGVAWVIYRIVNMLTNNLWAAFISAGALAFAPLVWSQAIIAEVYGVSLFFFAVLVWQAVQIYQGHKNDRFWLGAVFGLALGTHLTVVFILPILIWLLSHYNWRQWMLAILGVISGLLVFIYLPLRATQGPTSWGMEPTVSGFIAFVTGQIYRGYLFSVPANAIIPRVLAVAQYLTEVGFVPLVLLGFGFRWAWQHARSILYVVSVSSVLYVVYSIGYRTPDSYVYLMPVFVLVAIGVGLGFNHISSRLPRQWQHVLFGGVVLGFILWGGFRTGQHLDLTEDLVAETFWQSILDQAPPNAILLTYQDNHTFTLWYAQHVLQVRPDVAIVDTGLTSYPWYNADLQRIYPWLDKTNQLADIFQNHGEFTYPLCAILGSDQDFGWRLDCLTPS